LKLVRENINFERGMDPKKAMDLGTYAKIKAWMDEVGVGVKNFKVNNDLTIDTELDIIPMGRSELFPGGYFPPYIRFNTSGVFDIDDCGINSLIGCPKHVYGYFSCQMNKIRTLQGFPEKVDREVYLMSNGVDFTAQEIKEVCEVGREIQADDSDV